MTAPTGQASEIRNLAPAAPPRPLLDILADETSEKATNFICKDMDGRKLTTVQSLNTLVYVDTSCKLLH